MVKNVVAACLIETQRVENAATWSIEMIMVRILQGLTTECPFLIIVKLVAITSPNLKSAELLTPLPSLSSLTCSCLTFSSWPA